MLRTIRKYQKSVLGVVAIGLVALAMSGFGMNFLSQRKEPYAIKVGEAKIPFSQLANERKEIEDRYRQILGQSYGQLYKTLQKELPQQVVDQVVNREVLQQAAEKSGLYAGDDQVRNYLLQNVFPSGFTEDQYANFLQRQGVDDRLFEEGLRKEITRSQLVQLVGLGALPSEYEAKATLLREEQRYDLSYISLNSQPIIATIPQPTEEAIKTFYEANSTNFESPARAAYSYAEFKPSDFEAKVEVHPEDIEIEYSENLKRFMTPLEINARHIQFNIAKDASEEDKKKVRATADDVLSKLRSGGDFASLARQYSNDTATSLLGGTVGWLKRGTMNPAFDKAAFDLAAGTLSEVVEAPYGLHIIKVEERREPRQKTLDEVRAEIESAIRKREAPALAASLAQSYSEEFKKSVVPLAEFLDGKGLRDLAKEMALSPAATSPEGLPGLTRAALELNDEKGVVELKNSVLVYVTERIEPTIKSLSEVSNEIADILKAQAASEALQKKAQEISTKIKDGTFTTLAAVASATSSNPVSSPKIKLREQTSGFLGSNKTKESISAVNSAPKLIAEPLFSDGIFYFVQVDNIIPADEKELGSKITEQKGRIAQQLSQTITTELAEKLKAETDIDIKPEALR